MIGIGGLWPVLMLVAVPLAASKTVDVAITCLPSGKLQTIKVGGQAPQTVGDPVDERMIRRFLPDHRAKVRLSNSMQTPYRRTGGFIYTLQRLGYPIVSFISEPPAIESAR